MRKKLILVLLVLGYYAHGQTAGAYAVVIDEIMADPSPQVALPNSEFIELRNVSAQPFNLNGWRIGDANGFASIAVNFILQPDSCVIVCATSATAAMTAYGPTIGVSNFPSLDNDGDQLYIRSKEGKIIHAVEYIVAWYNNPVKSQGGFTLEMIDTHNPCGGAGNWTSSNDPRGGTPGKKNSVDAVHTDQQPPVLLRAYAADSITVVLIFDEPMDSAQASLRNNYVISDGIGMPVAAAAVSPIFNRVQLRTTNALVKNAVYLITATNVSDCSGNAIGSYNKVKVGRAGPAESFELVINEILFNPQPGGVDYVELYNRSKTIIDLKDCYIANRTSGLVGSLKQISADNRLLFPGEYIVITEDPVAVERQYLAKDPAAFVMLASPPSLPDDKGDVLILNGRGKVIDELQYDAHWQFKLISNDEGVALERIDYNKSTQDAANWHSAATSAGYGTPGYPNSQMAVNMPLQGSITVIPVIFSPDNDGFDDFLTLNYQFPEPGYVCNITIYDASGRIVRYLTHNSLCGLQGYFRWDGLDEKFSRLPIGVYVIATDVFNLKGKTSRFRQAVTLARKLANLLMNFALHIT